MKIVVLAGFLLLAMVTGAFGQVDSVLWRFGQTINRQGLEANEEILASDSLMGRETGTKGQKMAADYIRSRFEALNLKPPVGDTAYYQPFGLKKTAYNGVDLSVGKKDFKLFDDFYDYFSLTDTVLHMPSLVFAGYGIKDSLWNSYRGLEMKGKAAMILQGEPRDKDGNSLITEKEKSSAFFGKPSLKIREAKKQGVGLLLVVQEDYKRGAQRIKSYLGDGSLTLDQNMHEEQDAGLPVIFISPEAAGRILNNGKSLEKRKRLIREMKKPATSPLKMKVTLHVHRKMHKVGTENVAGLIEGTDKKGEVVAVTAHYDHLGVEHDTVVYNGADDDGSGTSSILEMAEAFSLAADSGYRPRRSILFIAFTGEEKGLLGSRHYTNHPEIPLDSTVADLNIDMIGRTDKAHKNEAEYVYLIGSDRLSSQLDEVSRKTNENYTGLKLDYKYNQKDDPNHFYERSDHYNFAKNDVPVIFYFRGVHEDYHQPGDEESKIEYDSLQRIARLVFYTAWNIANREERLQLDAGK